MLWCCDDTLDMQNAKTIYTQYQAYHLPCLYVYDFYTTFSGSSIDNRYLTRATYVWVEYGHRNRIPGGILEPGYYNIYTGSSSGLCDFDREWRLKIEQSFKSTLNVVAVVSAKMLGYRWWDGCSPNQSDCTDMWYLRIPEEIKNWISKFKESALPVLRQFWEVGVYITWLQNPSLGKLSGMLPSIRLIFTLTGHTFQFCSQVYLVAGRFGDDLINDNSTTIFRQKVCLCSLYSLFVRLLTSHCSNHTKWVRPCHAIIRYLLLLLLHDTTTPHLRILLDRSMTDNLYSERYGCLR